MKIKATTLAEKSDIEQNCEFYFNAFKIECDPKEYATLSEGEKREWAQRVKNDYSEWLGLSAEAQSNINTLKLLHGWHNTQNFVSFLSEVAAGIVDSHRDPLNREKVTLDPAIRTKNNQFIKKMEDENNTLTQGIQYKPEKIEMK